VRDLASKLTDFRAGITAIDADYVRPKLAASHLSWMRPRRLRGHGHDAFASEPPRALEAKGIDRADVDWVLATHVHLDHAGGAGALMQALRTRAAPCTRAARRTS
jgi:glyoxylase-like metal-dependent hydrolase (beta-lactamase superfamily II)